MHIIYVSQSRIPSQSANSVHVMKMAQGFAQQGATVDLFAQPGDPLLSTNEAFLLYGVSPDFELHLHGGGGMPLRGLRYRLSAALFAARSRSDLVYARNIRAALLAERLGRRSVVEVHRPSGLKRLRQYLRIARRPRIVVITQTLRRRLLEELACDPEYVIVAPDGADPIPEDTKPALMTAGLGRLRVGYLGSLERGKGMEVVEVISRACPWADFEIVGGKSSDVANWRQKLHNVPNVTFHGFQPHSETASYLRSFDIALLPNQSFVAVANSSSINISEWTSPLKAFEYMSAGLPILASDQENLREIFVHGRNALLCTPDDHHAWIKSLETLRDNPDLRKRLGETARADFLNLYSWKARAGRLLENLA